MSCLKVLTLDSSNFIFFFTDKTISSFSIIFVNKYLFIKNFIAVQNTKIFSACPLQVIEFPLKNRFVSVSLDKCFKFLSNSPTIDINISLFAIWIFVVPLSIFLIIKFCSSLLISDIYLSCKIILN